MRPNTLALILPALFLTGGVVAQQTAVASSATPDVTYTPGSDAFVFCSAQDCSGTCELVDPSTIADDVGQVPPNNMAYQSIYWYDPNHYTIILYTCVDHYDCASRVSIGPDTCYNLYENGVATAFDLYWFVSDAVA